MLGDAQVTLPSYQTTLGVTINTAPAAIWPWLMQMGYRRGGLYSYDWLDRLFGYLDAPSTERILPQWQVLAVGEEIPIGRGGGFPVKAVEPCRSLVLAGQASDVEWSVEFASSQWASDAPGDLAQSREDSGQRSLSADDARHRARGISDDAKNVVRHRAPRRKVPTS